MRFVLLFIEAKGLTFLLERLAQMDYRTRQSEEHLNTVKCISSLMNNTHGLKCVISHPDSMTIIAQSLHTTDIPTKIRVLEILGGVCLIPEGHRKVLHALSHFCRFAVGIDILFTHFFCPRTLLRVLLSTDPPPSPPWGGDGAP